MAQASRRFRPQEFTDADAGGIKQLQRHNTAALGRSLNESCNFALFQDALREAVAVRFQLHSSTEHLNGKYPVSWPKDSSRLDCCKNAVLAGGFQPSLLQQGRVGLYIGERDPTERFFNVCEKALHVGAVGATGMNTDLHFRPRVPERDIVFAGWT